MCEAKKSRPGDLNGAPRGQAERGLGDFSGENITQEAQNVNDENDHTTTRKSPVSPGELIEPGYNGEVSLKSAYKKTASQFTSER